MTCGPVDVEFERGQWTVRAGALRISMVNRDIPPW